MTAREYGSSNLKSGPVLTRAETDAMEMRVMSIGCTDMDFRRLMDSHESLRNIVAWYSQRTQNERTKLIQAEILHGDDIEGDTAQEGTP